VAKSLGGVLKEELKLQQEVIAVDGIDVGDLDYIDIGRPLGVSRSIFTSAIKTHTAIWVLFWPRA